MLFSIVRPVVDHPMRDGVDGIHLTFKTKNAVGGVFRNHCSIFRTATALMRDLGDPYALVWMIGGMHPEGSADTRIIEALEQRRHDAIPTADIRAPDLPFSESPIHAHEGGRA